MSDQDSKLEGEELHEQRMSNIRPHQFPQGVSGNPRGRPKGPSVKNQIRKIIEDAAEQGDDIPKALARMAITKALKGDYRFWNAVYESLDGSRTAGGVNVNAQNIQIVFEDLKPPEGYEIPEPPDELLDMPDVP